MKHKTRDSLSSLVGLKKGVTPRQTVSETCPDLSEIALKKSVVSLACCPTVSAPLKRARDLGKEVGWTGGS